MTFPFFISTSLFNTLEVYCLDCKSFFHISDEAYAFQEYFIRHIDGYALNTASKKERVINCLKAAIECRLCEVTREFLEKGIAVCKDGAPFRKIDKRISCQLCCPILGLTSMELMFSPPLMTTPSMYLWWMDG
ncbi:uncharacterized protein LOC107466407 [Arachis duranensis]|uniref:Uncharacterized protein LOC107466407 n=1 Tax=Arachis duranensis TaxID=130453 RepID=A0A6P5MT96_ARADU|nr:uncharacterized protein LOC107466407 [Arachis duranensis]XP_025619730.1 uncharacterized protein LOC112711315 [Arachis hypogaea]XP_029144996.1 uncharacterized protein LOC112711315 [Arachis hypogaea]